MSNLALDYLQSLPPILQEDASAVALAKSVAEQLEQIAIQIPNNVIYSRIDCLSENIVDILAFDLHVDWYDYRLPLETKREVVKKSVTVHRYLGTKYAVETVLKEVYRDARIIEWFEMEPRGKPATFALDLDITETAVPKELQEEMLRRIDFYKNLRSHLVGLQLRIESRGCFLVGGYPKVRKRLHIKAKE